MFVDRVRVPRWMLRNPRLQPLLQALHKLRKKMFLRPEERAQRLLAEGGPDQPAELLQRKGPGRAADPRSLLDAAHFLFAAGRHDEAADAASRAVRLFPGKFEAWVLLGQIECVRAPDGRSSRGRGDVPHESALPIDPSQRLIAEDAETADILARPAPEVPAAPATATDEAAALRLSSAVEALHAENLSLACGLDLLRQQLGHRIDALETWVKYEHTKYYMRNLSLYMRKYGAMPTVPAAVQDMPKELRRGFSADGQAVIQQGYLNAAYPDHYMDIYTDFDIETYKRVWRGEPVAAESDQQCQKSFGMMLGATDLAIERAAKARLKPGQQVAVIGSRGPIYEALGVLCGAHPTTIRRTPVDNRTSDVKSLTISEWDATDARFDAAIAVNVVEQFGLGMHGEPLDPDGDLGLMHRLKRSLKPGGILLLVVPTGADCTVFNATRIYGAARLRHLLEGWVEVERHRNATPLFHGRGEDRSLFVLENAA
ncbi:MAG: DUF268 domain-containing protein [Vicinamibacterales bacterium]